MFGVPPHRSAEDRCLNIAPDRDHLFRRNGMGDRLTSCSMIGPSSTSGLRNAVAPTIFTLRACAWSSKPL
jgi:hypothetical protein